MKQFGVVHLHNEENRLNFMVNFLNYKWIFSWDVRLQKLWAVIWFEVCNAFVLVDSPDSINQHFRTDIRQI